MRTNPKSAAACEDEHQHLPPLSLSAPLPSGFSPTALLHSFPYALCLVGRNYELLFANEKASALLPAETEPPTLFLNCIPVADREKVKAYIDHAFRGKECSYELKLEDKDRFIWMKVICSPVADNTGITGVCMTLEDITERKKLALFKQELSADQEKLYRHRKLFESFMENAPFVAWVTDEQGIMQYMNPLYQNTYGRTKAEIGKSIYELFPPQIAVDYHFNNMRVIKSGKALETTEQAQLPDGSVQILKIYKFPLAIHNKPMVGGWAIDITEHVHLQEELTKSVERYHYANEATSDAIYDWNLQTGKIYRGVGFETLFGYTEKSVSLKSLLSRIHLHDLEKYKATVFAALRSSKKTGWKLEYRLQNAAGQYRYVVDKAYILNDDKRAVRVIGAIQDLTEQKLLQKKLVQQEKKNKREVVRSIIEAQEKERRQLSVELHDNVNQMLASCKLMLEVACENKEAAPMLVQKSYQSVQTIISEIRRISHDLNPSAIDDIGLEEAIHEMVDKINATRKVKVLACFEQSHHLKRLQSEDKVAIYRIVQEQVNNILKHAQAKNIFLALSFPLPAVSIEIKDDGIGFSLDKIKKGLGLRNIQNRVDYYNGKMKIETAPGKGCTLKVLLNLKA